jgi:hypothetical protein
MLGGPLIKNLNESSVSAIFELMDGGNGQILETVGGPTYERKGLPHPTRIKAPDAILDLGPVIQPMIRTVTIGKPIRSPMPPPDILVLAHDNPRARQTRVNIQSLDLFWCCRSNRRIFDS